MNHKEETKNILENDEIPIYGVYFADWDNVPFADLYLDIFPEQYDVE